MSPIPRKSEGVFLNVQRKGNIPDTTGVKPCVSSGFCDVTSGLTVSTKDRPPAPKSQALSAEFSPLGWFLESLAVF